jgi:hypothetical protein
MTDTRRAYSAGRIFASADAWSRAGIIIARYGLVVIRFLIALSPRGAAS